MLAYYKEFSSQQESTQGTKSMNYLELQATCLLVYMTVYPSFLSKVQCKFTSQICISTKVPFSHIHTITACFRLPKYLAPPFPTSFFYGLQYLNSFSFFPSHPPSIGTFVSSGASALARQRSSIAKEIW